MIIKGVFFIKMKKFLILFLTLITLLGTVFGCAEKDVKAPVSFDRVELNSFIATGNATVRLSDKYDNLPIGVGLDNPPDGEVVVITFNGTYGAGGVEIDKNLIEKGTYLTFTYFYERTCTPTFLGILLLRLQGEARGTYNGGKYVMEQFDAKGRKVAGTFNNSDGMINGNLKNNWLTVQAYFETPPTENLKFGCVWLNNGVSANFYLTDIRISKASLMA